ncbi:hypothetical protein D9M72_466780 [compost metagenome]
MRGEAAQHGGQLTQGRGQHDVDQRCHVPGDLQPARQPAQREVRERPQLALIVVAEELGLVGGHIHARGAVAGTCLAGQAQVKRFPYLLGLPAFVHGAGAPDHVLQHTGAAAGGIFFVPGGPVAGAHHAAGVCAATAHADARLDGVHPRIHAAAGGVGRVVRFAGRAAAGVQRPQVKAGAPFPLRHAVQCQVLIQRVGVGEGAGIQDRNGIPQPAEV